MTEILFGGRSFAAFQFDMDGTLLTSIEAAERVWTRWATRHGLDVEAFLPTLHGKRAIDTIRQLALPGVDADAEAEALTRDEIDDVDGVREIGAAGAFLASLPPDRWAIVTSAPRALALARLGAAGLTPPAVFVTADDVTIGKPAPDCYLLAAERLGVSASDCLIFEDAPAGIEAAERAGANVVVIQATHTAPLATEHASVDDYEALSAAVDGDGTLLLRRG
ncbi:glycerol-3-phosphatase [Kaistia sp. 32K]|uniref:HAD-IA family hydrolase n=1 Tax=Kaistia sp. 32K TaxID=2795690 RepID=UPI0019377679|nr:HAD-IA family hydrolase [Kaistia sp. 32K]BCP54836.1 glycerol-3-phosphatase [Kaistia sp. 32K]